ncbi:MAG TPA: alkaline phosphatase, partial [Acidimicrobiales bacterium]
MGAQRKILVGSALAVAGLVAATTAGAGSSDGDRTREVRQAIDGGKAKNVIMFLGDGMGDSEITIARNY